MEKYDRWILLTTVALVCFGALMIYSSTSVITPVLAKKNVTEFYYFKRHLFTIVLGFIILFIASCKLRLSFVQKYATHLLIISFILLVLVFIPGIGVTAGGATRWIRLWPSTFQPSELVKLSMVIFLAHYLSKPGYRADSFTSFLKPIGMDMKDNRSVLHFSVTPKEGLAVNLCLELDSSHWFLRRFLLVF